MAKSTWNNIVTGLHTATYNSYAAKTKRQRQKREVVKVMDDVDGFCQRKRTELLTDTYHIGKYRHFSLKDKKKTRAISVLPYEDRCVQNSIKDAIQPLILRYMTDDMLGGLPGCGVTASDPRHCVVQQVRKAMNNHRFTHVLQGDISKFYDNVDKVVSIQILERKITDKHTLSVIRQHLFNQKKLAIGDPFSHLIANMNMSVIIRKAKDKYGDKIEIVNFADDFLGFGEGNEILAELERDMRKWADEIRLKYKPMYIRPIDAKPGKKFQPIIFCGYQFGRWYVKIAKHTKQRYIKARHSERSMGSYNGILQVADTKHLRKLIERKDNRHMDSKNKIRRPFAGRPMKIETMEGIKHTIVDMTSKASRQKDTESYMHIQAIAEGLGLVVYSTGSSKICEYLKNKSKHDLPLQDMVIVHDWSGYYYEGTVYTDAEEEAMIREQFNIH